MTKVGSLYNDLINFENNWFWKKKLEKNTAYPVHKPFIVPFELADGSNIYDVNEWVLNVFNFTKNTFFLDAGCGIGQTSFLICSKHQSKGIGISLSINEIKLANKIAKDNNQDQDINFRECSFEASFSNTFDVIIAVESLKHSPKLKDSIANFSKHLKDGGVLIVVDDLFVKEIAIKQALIQDFKAFWEVKNAYSVADYLRVADSNNLKLVEEINFTDHIQSTNILIVNIKIFILSFLKIFPFGKYFKRLLNVFIGGFIQDKIYSIGGLEYKGLVFRKTDDFENEH